MYLIDMKKGQSGHIVQINAEKVLKDRLNSFGIMRGETLTVKGCSLANQTIKIEVGTSLIAVRADEAKTIEVELIS